MYISPMFFLNGHNSSIFKAHTSASVVSMLALAPTSHVIRARRLIQQQKGNVSWQRETFRKGLNVTSGAQLIAALPLVKPVVWFVLTVINWCSCSVAKSAYYYLHSTALYTYFLHCSMSRGNVVSQTCQT